MSRRRLPAATPAGLTSSLSGAPESEFEQGITPSFVLYGVRTTRAINGEGKRGVSETRYFEKGSGGVVWHWQISRDGIRCHMAWGQAGGTSRGSSMTLDDEAHAERHFNKKISEKKRKGYVEVDPPAPAEKPASSAGGSADVKLLDAMREYHENRYEGAWDLYWQDYEPVDGHERAFSKFHDFQGGPGPFHDYLVLSEDERRGLSFVVKEPGHDPGHVSAFLSFVSSRVDLAFDGRSHHKLPLPSPIGQFDHVLICAPSLNNHWYGGRQGKVLPILDCEIGDDDTETFVEARLKGRDSMPSTTWDRDPCPVIDLKFDLRNEKGFTGLNGRTSMREKKFKVYPRSTVDRVLRLLPEADPGSRLEIRNYKGGILTVTPADLSPETPADIDRFLLTNSTGDTPPA